MCKKTVVAWFLLLGVLGRLSAADSPIINEFMAVNTGPLRDEDNDLSDWIEIHNPTTNTVNLGGWYLTDSANNPTKWAFPATNIGPNGYLVVFASSKDRRVAGRTLHTNFRLEAGGEYLGLVRPDGATVVSQFSPKFPAQVQRVSYGLPAVQSVTTLIATGAVARYYIPSNDTLGGNWVAPGFDHSTWGSGNTGIGYETDGQGPFTPATIANSVAEFSGRQGSNGWYYGYWDKKADGNGVYSDVDMGFFPNAAEPYGANNYFDGTSWTWFNGNPPFTRLTAAGGQPNANNGNASRADHWAIRRWISEFNGAVKITGRLNHTSDWVYVTHTGVAANSALYVYLTAAGDGWIDDMKLVAGSVAEQGANLLPNGEFESALSGPWTVSANHSASTIDTSVKKNGNSSLRIVASVGGTTQASAIWQNITPALTVGSIYTLSYWYKPGTNNAPLVARFSGNWIDARPTFCGDGVMARIFVDGTEVFSQAAFVNSPTYSITVPVNFGSRVDFALDPRADDLCDFAEFTASVETTDPANAVVADTVADWSFTGTQGEKNWFYGYYNRTTDPGGVYAAGDFTPFPRANTAHSPTSYWTGTMWDWFAGNPPWTEIGQQNVHPNGVNNGAEHWAIRRWVSEVSGRITVDWHVRKANASGNGVTGRILHNGVEKDVAIIAGADSVGVTRSIVISNVAVGDFIDVALDPRGTGGSTDDGADGSIMTAVIRGAPTLTDSIASSVQAQMKDVNSTAYIRIPFEVTDPSDIDFLSLRLKFDDGFIAYLNGVNVGFQNAPIPLETSSWNSMATASRFDGDVNFWEQIDLTSFKGLLTPGTNVLAIHGLNVAANDTDFLILPTLTATRVTFGTNDGYFASPTPGGPNGNASTNLGPIISDVEHMPTVPKDHEDLVVRASVFRTFNAVSNVQMTYRVMFSNEVTVPMFDDGAHGDGAAGDGVYAATIPATAAQMGQMIRYYISATDVRTNRSRLPTFENPLGSPEYFGTIVYVPETNNLPVLHWFIQNPTGPNTAAGGRVASSIFFKGQFRDNVRAFLHGQSSSGFNTLKKSYNFDLNPGENLEVWEDAPDVDDFNLLTTYADKSHMRNMINYQTYIDAGMPAHRTFAVRVQQNGTFFAVYNFGENGDANYLQRIGFDENGAFYKMYNSAENTTGVEKKTRKNETNADLQALINGSSQGTIQARMNYAYDNMDIPAFINFLAVKAITSDHDCCHKNYYFYRDTDGTGEWAPLPWDADLSLGRIWSSGPTYFDDNNYTNQSWMVGGNTVMSIFYNTTTPTFRQMYMRRVRSLMDQFLGKFPGTNSPYYEALIEEQKGLIGPDAMLDFSKWTSWGISMTMTQNANQILTNYVPGRRAWLNTAQPEIPAPQPTNASLQIVNVEFNPSSGNQAQEFITITNPNNYSLDISGWELSGAVRFTFKGGTVLPPNSAAYVVGDKVGFRTRTAGPRAGQGLFLVGPYQGQLSAHGESLVITDTSGRLVTSNAYVGAPSLAQQFLRITELMYNPSPLAGSPYAAEEFEYIELKNIGGVAVPLTGVHFTNGIDFAFGPANLTTLAAGQTVILARNPAAFASRYPSVTAPVFAYSGALNNGGETIRFDDAVGEKILEFAYNNTWYPMTDGNGFSLVIRDENAPWYTWDTKAAWRASGVVNGSPGSSDAVPAVIGEVVVNEILAHTDLPDVDAIEIHNGTTNAIDIGHWWISDDFFEPKKFRIAAPRVIPPGGFAVFTENDFGAGANGFSFGSTGDDAYIFSGDANGNLTGYYHGYAFAPSANGVAFGRHTNSLGEIHLVAQGSNTLGSANSAPKVGPVIISEVMYRPPDVNGLDNTIDEFVELQNITTNDVPLFDPAALTNRWVLQDGVSYTFSTNDWVPANGFLVLVNFDPQANAAALADFRAKYSVPSEVRIVGPYSGKLDNNGETLELLRPDNPNTNEVPYILVERVRYADVLPWDGGADGFGPSLQRRFVAEYANEPTNWLAALPSVGTTRSPLDPPAITAQPQSITIVEGMSTNLDVFVSGTAPFGYQWRKNGASLAGQTGSALSFNPVQLSDAGTYSVVVFNAAGVAFSSNAVLTVRPLPVISLQPTNMTPPPGSNATMTVGATGTGTMRYQWYFNEQPIAGATNASHTVTNADLFTHTGFYFATVTDEVSSRTSRVVSLIVYVRPFVIAQPVAQTVVRGGNAFYVMRAGPNHPMLPLVYRWLRSGSPYATNTTGELVVTNAQVSTTWRVQAVNAAGNVNSTTVALNVLNDADGDGMADVYEMQYGLSTNNASDALLDNDSDGMTNHDELIAGTNPNDPASVLKLTTSGITTTLEFLAQTNNGYSVQYRTNVDTAPWVTITNVPPQASGVRTIQFTVPAALPEGARYHRIVTPPLP
jgi:hypothetical protein